MNNVDLEKIGQAVELDLGGKAGPMEVLLGAGRDDIWEALLSHRSLPPVRVEAIYSDKFVNELDVTRAIEHPNLTWRVARHVTSRGSERDIFALLKAHPGVRRQAWFADQVTTNQAARTALSVLAISEGIDPEDVANLPPAVASAYVTFTTPTAVLCQILFDHKEVTELRHDVILALHANRTNMHFSRAVNSALMQAMHHEGDDDYRQMLGDILKTVTPPNFY